MLTFSGAHWQGVSSAHPRSAPGFAGGLHWSRRVQFNNSRNVVVPRIEKIPTQRRGLNGRWLYQFVAL